MKVTTSMFDQIKSALKKPGTGGNQAYKEQLKFEAGKTYVVRLLVNPDEPAKSIVPYYQHGWKSTSTGQYMSVLCPSTYGESCPIDNYVRALYREGTEEAKNVIRLIGRKENSLVNVYVVSDPTNPANEGKVKVLRYGVELGKIISSALDGDDAEEFGPKIFDLQNGCSLRIKCDQRKGTAVKTMVTYAASRFLSPSKLEGMTDDKVEEIYNNIVPPHHGMEVKTAAELQRFLDEHYHGKTIGSAAPASDQEDTDDSPPFKPSPTISPASSSKAAIGSKVDDIFEGVADASTPIDSDDELQNFLASFKD